MAMDTPEPSSISNKNSASSNKFRWSEFEEQDGATPVNLDFLLPPPQVIGPDENGIKKVIEYKFNKLGDRVRVTTTTRVRKLASTRLSRRAVERRSWTKFGDAIHDDVGSRLTMVSIEEIFLERRKAPGGEAEEAKNSMAQLGKGAVLMVCRSCGMEGDHWTARCPNPKLTLSTDTATGLSSARNTNYVPPSRREGADKSIGSDMRRRNDVYYAVRFNNLSEDTEESDLVELCSPFGHVGRAHVPKDYITGLGRGYGFVNFLRKEDAQRAINKLDGYGYDNLILRAEWSETKTN